MLRAIRKFLRRVFLLAAAIVAVYAGFEGYTFYADELSPEITIRADWGGDLEGYIDRHDRWRNNGRTLRIDSFCVSACTLALARFEPERICATPTAILGFHSASDIYVSGARKFSPAGTALMWTLYTPELQAYLRERGWDAEDPAKAEHPSIIYVRGADVYKFVRPCS